MTAELLRREFATQPKTRKSQSGRTVFGIAVPFDTPTRISDWEGDYTEIFRHGAFTTATVGDPARVKLLVNHDGHARLPIGHATQLREDPGGLYAEFHVPETTAGDDALELIRAGTLDSFSIGFRAIRTEWTGDRHDGTGNATAERLEAHLHEVSIVAFPAYPDATIAGTRQQHSSATAARARLRLSVSLAR